MKTIILAIPVGVFVAALAWKAGSVLSPDAIGMAVGLIFGALAGIPAALLVVAAGHRRDDFEDVYQPPEPRRRLPPPSPTGRIWVVVDEDPADPEAYPVDARYRIVGAPYEPRR